MSHKQVHRTTKAHPQHHRYILRPTKATKPGEIHEEERRTPPNLVEAALSPFWAWRITAH